MPNPRLMVEFDGLNIETASYKIDASTITYDASKVGGSAAVGLAVTLSADDTVALAADADAIEGKLLQVHADGICTVQVGGFAALPGGLSATLTRGLQVVGALGAASAKGYVRAVNSAVAAELAKARGRIVRNGTTTAVVVDLC